MSTTAGEVLVGEFRLLRDHPTSKWPSSRPARATERSTRLLRGPWRRSRSGPARHILLNPVDRDRAARKVIGSFPGTRKSDGPDILSALILVEGRELDAAPLHGALKPQAGRRLPSTGVTHTIPLRPAHLAAAVLLVGGPLRRHHRRLQRLQRLRRARTLIRPDASIRAVVFLRAPGNADRRWELPHVALVARTEHPSGTFFAPLVCYLWWLTLRLCVLGILAVEQAAPTGEGDSAS